METAATGPEPVPTDLYRRLADYECRYPRNNLNRTSVEYTMLDWQQAGIPEAIVLEAATKFVDYLHCTALVTEQCVNISELEQGALQARGQSDESAARRLAICRETLGEETAAMAALGEEILRARDSPDPDDSGSVQRSMVYRELMRRWAKDCARYRETIRNDAAKEQRDLLPKDWLYCCSGGTLARLEFWTGRWGGQPFILYLQRHEETDATRRGYLSAPDSKLTEDGIRRLKQNDISELSRVSRIFTSPDRRAEQTAEILARRLGIPVEEIVRVLDGGERRVSKDWLERPLREFPDLLPEGSVLIMPNGERQIIDAAGIEPLDIFLRRCENVGRFIAAHCIPRAAYAGHGLTNRAILPGLDPKLYKMPYADLLELPGAQEPGSVVDIYYSDLRNRPPEEYPALPDDHLVWGTLLERQMRALRYWVLQYPREEIPTLRNGDLSELNKTAATYHCNVGADIPVFNELSGSFDVRRALVLTAFSHNSPDADMVVKITKPFHRSARITLAPNFRELFPDVAAQLPPPPPPHTTFDFAAAWAADTCQHYWATSGLNPGYEIVASPLCTMPEAWHKLMLRVTTLALRQINEMNERAGKPFDLASILQRSGLDVWPEAGHQ